MVAKKYNANEGKTEVMVSTWKMKKRWRNTNKFKNGERERERGGGVGVRQTDRHRERRGWGGGRVLLPSYRVYWVYPLTPQPRIQFLAHSTKQRATELSKI